MPLKISYKDTYSGGVFRETKDFINHHIFRVKCWACHFFNMENIVVSYPYGLCLDNPTKQFCRIIQRQIPMTNVGDCPKFREQLAEEYIPIIQLANEYRILL